MTTTSITVVVTGGRDYEDRRVVFDTLDAIHAETPIRRLAQGECRTGADRLARLWALEHGACLVGYHALWQFHGTVAGPIRNRAMINAERPDIVVAFPGNRGTADCCAYAESEGFTVVRYPAGPDRLTREGR